MEPDIGEVVDDGSVRLEIPTGEGVNIIDESRSPVARISIERIWDPREVTYADASKNLNRLARAEIKTELDRIAHEAESVDYVFPDTANRSRVLIWLFERVRCRLSFEDIAHRKAGRLPARDLVDDSTVRKAVKKMADTINLDLQGIRTKPAL